MQTNKVLIALSISLCFSLVHAPNNKVGKKVSPKAAAQVEQDIAPAARVAATDGDARTRKMFVECFDQYANILGIRDALQAATITAQEVDGITYPFAKGESSISESEFAAIKKSFLFIREHPHMEHIVRPLRETAAQRKSIQEQAREIAAQITRVSLFAEISMRMGFDDMAQSLTITQEEINNLQYSPGARGKNLSEKEFALLKVAFQSMISDEQTKALLCREYAALQLKVQKRATWDVWLRLRSEPDHNGLTPQAVAEFCAKISEEQLQQSTIKHNGPLKKEKSNKVFAGMFGKKPHVHPNDCSGCLHCSLICAHARRAVRHRKFTGDITDEMMPTIRAIETQDGERIEYIECIPSNIRAPLDHAMQQAFVAQYDLRKKFEDVMRDQETRQFLR